MDWTYFSTGYADTVRGIDYTQPQESIMLISGAEGKYLVVADAAEYSLEEAKVLAAQMANTYGIAAIYAPVAVIRKNFDVNVTVGSLAKKAGNRFLAALTGGDKNELTEVKEDDITSEERRIIKELRKTLGKEKEVDGDTDNDT